MNSKRLLILCLALIQTASSRPRNKILALEPEQPEPDAKVREKRKYDIAFLKQLEESGVGVKKSAAEDEHGRGGTKTEAPETGKGSKRVEETQGPEVPPVVDQESGSRVKKQSPNNVCIKIGGCGKTACGPMVSARGASANDMRVMMQGGKSLVGLGDFQPPLLQNRVDASSKPDQFTPVQGRTFDTFMGITPVSMAGYGSPAVYAAAPADNAYGHSFFKPQTIPTMAVISHQPSHSLVHPMLLPHLVPHLVPSIGSFFAPHRLEPVPADLKQPAYPAPSYVGADNTLLCTPFRNQRLDGPYDYVYKPDLAIDKSLNVTDSSKKSQSGEEEERRAQENLKKVNEIKEEISQLNRAAQRIVDQQERLSQMQQKQLWGGSAASGQAPSHASAPYMGGGYYTYPGAPWGYSRSNILSYPNTHDDVEFFLNLLRAGKKMGLFADSFQPPSLSALGEALRGVQKATSTQKETDNANLISGDKTDSGTDKKLIK